MRKKFLLSKFLVLLILITGSVGVASAQIAKIGDDSYSTLAESVAAANGMTGDVTVEIYGAGEFTDGMELNGSYTSINFIGKNAEAKLTVNQTAQGDYLEAHGKIVSFTDLILAKANPAWSGNSGHMGNYFSIQGGTVTYTGCTFPNGACTSGATANYISCTFQNSSEYGLWVYDDALVTVNGGIVDSKKGIKVYSEGEESVTSTLTVKNATFTENVTAKPAVAVGYAQSITLIDNTYNNPTAHVELDSGSDADCEGITFVAQDAEGNDIASTLKMTDRSNLNASCGVLCDGKIYTTVTEAASDATPGSTVTLLYNSTETVELPAGVILDTNGYTADGVTVAAPVEVATYDELVAALVNGGVIKLTADITATGAVDGTDANIDLNDKTLTLSVGGNNFFGDSKVKNGSINITGCVASGDCIIGIGDYSNSATLTFDNVNVTGDGYSSAFAVLYVYNSSELNINGGSVVVSNDNASAGGVIIAHKAADGKINIVGTEGNPVKLTFNNAKIGMLDGTVLMNYVDLDITGGANAINQSALTIKNSTLDITGADGRALTLSQGDVVVENSTLNFSDCSEGEIRFKKSLELTTDNTSTINECTTYADASATDAKINGVDVDASESSMAVVTVENGTTTVKEAPQGNDFTGYTSTDNAIWGETWGNASESFVIKVLDANGNVMGTTSLNNIGGIIDGDVNVTWSLKLDVSNTDEYWTMEWTTAPNINKMPAKVELWVDGVKVSGGNVVLNGPDEINKIYAAVTDNNGKIYSYHTSIANAVDAITGTRSVTPNVIALLRNTDETVTLPAGITLNLNGFTAANVSVPVAQIGETPYYTLAEAVAAAESGATITLLNGEHELPLFANKELTFVGESKEGVIVNDAPAAVTQGWNGSTFHFENLTAKGATENYHGLANGVKAVTYNNCKINGLRFLYATNGVSFEDCTFNAEGVEHSFWTYGASNVTVTDCTFEYTDRAVNCYSENGANHELDITFEGCSFTYAGTNDTPEGAVEINSGSVKSIDLVMNDCTAPAEGAMWFNSQWDSKKGENTVVTIDDIIVWQVLPVAMIGDVQYKSLQAALDAAAAVTGNVTVEILRNIDLTGIDWNPVTVSDPGYPSVTVNGNDYTITGLNDMLFAGTWAGGSGLIINDLTIANSTIVNDENDANGNIGVGAFIGFPQASATITLNNCHLVNSTVKGGHWTGGLIGYAAGYAGTDGPVFMELTITGCYVTGSTITGKGSAGGIIGHGSGNAWTNVVIENTTVSGNTITSTGSSTNKAGAIMGTIGAAGQPTTVNGVTHTGGATVSATVSGNTVKSNNVEITTIYGRQGTETGMLELNGGSYDKYPIEEDVTYAAPAEGFKIEVNEDGTYGVVVDPAYGKVAKVGDVYYETLAEAYNAATDGQTITLLNNITLSEKFVIAKSITLDGNDKTLTYTGSNRAIDIYDESNNVAEVTIKNLIVESTSEYCERGINYNESGNLTLDKVTINGIGEERALTYAINLPGYSDNANVTITNSNLNGYGVLNIWGTDVTVNVENSTLHAHNHISGGPNTFAAIVLNSNPSINEIANGTVVNVNGGKIITSRGEGCETMSVGRIDSETGVINISTETVIENNGGVEEYIEYSVARDNGGAIYNSLQDAIDVAQTGATITIIRNFNIDNMITVAAGKELTIDLNGKTITGTDNTTKNFSIIDNRGNLTITDSSDPSTGKITLTATTNSGWNRYSAVIANNPGGKLTIEAGTLEHLGGTDMAYGIDNLTNGKGTYAETVINGGYIKSTYRGIRQFLNGTEAQNILTVYGGTIEGTNKSIWMQDPSVNANTGTLAVRKEANLIGDVYLYVTPNSTSWPVEVSIADGALAEGSEIITGNVPAGYELKLVDGVYSVCSVEAKIGEVTYATLAAAVNAANEGDTITLVTDITFTEATRTHNSGSWYDGLYYIGDKSFTIDLDSYTIGHDNSVNDYLLNFKNNGAKANVINLINGTIEAGSTAYCALATSSSNTNKITINTENINIINNNSNGSTIKVRGGVELNVNAGTVITGKDSYLGIECVASTVNIYDGAEIYMNGSTSYNGCLVGACANGTVNVYGGYGEGVKGGFIAMTSGGTINVAGGEWIANTDGTVGDNSNLYVLTAQNNKNESGYAGASIINVTGGTFRGGMDAWILNDANVEKAELNISGGNFNADPTSYVVSTNYKVVNEDDGTYTVEVDGFEKFYTAEGVETTQDQAAYSLMFNVTDNENNELSVKIGSKKPAQNSSINLVTPVTATFDGITFNVTSVADNGFNSTRFKTVTISEGVATIGTKALANMSALTDIVFPSTLKSIGDNCFYGYGENHKIKTITCYAEEAPVAASHYTEVPFQMVICKVAALIVPNAVSYEEYATAPGWSRFYEEPNGGLINHILGIGTELEIAGKDDKYTMIATITSMDPMECSIKIGNTKPAANSNAELVIPEVVDYFPSVEGLDFTVTSIPDQAFSSCLYFVGDLVIPQNVRTIGASAFNTSHFVANETVRGTLTLNAGLVSIGSQAFKKDYFKGDLSIPSTVETIASNAFQYASFDGILTINGNIDCANAFGGTGFTELVLVKGVEEIKDSNAFSGMLSLKEVVLPSTLQTVGMAAFKDDDAIEVIHTYATEVPAINSIPGNVNYKYAFSETVKANAVLYVHGTSYDDVLKYKNATNEWNEFANIHLYGAVATIDEVEYLTIQEAMDAAQNEDVVTIITDVELTTPIVVAADDNFTLNLNGHAVYYTTTEYKGEAMITNNGNLTINDSAEGGKLSYAYEGGANSSYGFGNSTIENKGVLTINAGTVENTSAAMSHASYAINTGAGATLNVEGGNILNLNGHAVRMVSFGTELNTVNINDGYIEGTRALQVQLPGSASSTTKPAMDLNITGGELMSNEETYNLAIYVFSNGQSAENVSVEISGGTFNGNVAVNAAATNSMLANAVAITGGTFNGEWGVFSYSDEDAAQAVISITGGTFATNYSEWYAEDEQYVFELNENGTYSVVEQTIFTQTTQLNTGWNWFSYYVNTDLETLENELGESAAQIKSHTQGFDIYAGPETWSGTLNEILPEQMYMINANEPSTLNLKGETIDHENVEIILVKNAWNWIGYPINGSVNLSDAFNGVEITIGDQIKSHNHGFAYYIGNNTWTGDLQVLVKGEGYMYHNTSNNDVVFTYNVPQGKSNSELKSNITTNGNYWIPNASQYPNNMTMTAMVDVEGGDYEVAAFVDGEVRGSARPIYVEPIDAYVLFLTIHGEGVEEMTFKFYDLTTGEEFDLNDRMNYSDDAIVGSLKEPYMFNRGTTGIGEAAMSEVNIYPNPTTTGTEINLQATCDTVEVFNALGVKVAEYHNVDSIDAFETAGIYVIRITDNGNVHNCRLAVK
ncbi:MAG: leucine-rich repeat protein [Bacteroidales bacterium]|nr:leucine-rich repeat protein [Bacteroidales bacterium]